MKKLLNAAITIAGLVGLAALIAIVILMLVATPGFH